MDIKTISYRQVKNIGNYESKHCEMTAELDDNDDVEQCTQDLIAMVHKSLGIETKKPEPVNYDKNPF